MINNGNKYGINDPVIELVGKDFKNKKIINKEFINKNALIKFYAPWCSHCSNMVYDLNFLAKNLKSHGFKVGAVNTQNITNKDISM